MYLCLVDHSSLYNLVNKTNLVHNLFLVYLSISICFGRLCAHHQEKLLYLCDTWYFSLCMDEGTPCIPDNHPHKNKYQVSHKHSCFSWWWTHSRPKHIEIDKYTKNKYAKNKLCTNLALFTRLSAYVFNGATCSGFINGPSSR